MVTREVEERGDIKAWIERSLYIRTKERAVIPFLLNEAQLEYFAHRTGRDMILKPRQLGFTTLVSALFFHDTIMHPNTVSVIVAHDRESTQLIFRIAQLFWERVPDDLRQRAGPTRYSNRREFLWPKINSAFYVGTAGAMTFGRGSTVNNLHCSEFGFWRKPEESLAAMLEAVPEDGRVVIESTANGMGNFFHDLWMEAQGVGNEWNTHFYVWWEDPSNRLPIGAPLGSLTADERAMQERYNWDEAQIRWRRARQRRLRDRFRQEYPEDDVTCFLAHGRCCFDVDRLVEIQQAIAREDGPAILPTLQIGDAPPVAVSPARLSIWKTPQKGQQYVIGADVGEGLARGDASCAIVLDRHAGEQVAELHGRVSPDRFAHLLAALGNHYNGAVVAVERNNHGHSTLNTLRNVCRYRRLYHHVSYDHRRGQQATLGWPTDQATKPILVDDLAAVISDGAIQIHSPALVDECMTFVTTDTGAQEAEEGKYDDRVMAAGIAWQARKRGVSRGLRQRPPGF